MTDIKDKVTFIYGDECEKNTVGIIVFNKDGKLYFDPEYKNEMTDDELQCLLLRGAVINKDGGYFRPTSFNRQDILHEGEFNLGGHMYRFGVLSDVHIRANNKYNSEEDLIKAMRILQKRNCESVSICGDLTTSDTAEEMATFKRIIDENVKIPVYAASGNHDDVIADDWITYLGHKKRHIYTRGNDVFIYIPVSGGSGSSSGGLSSSTMDWLEESVFNGGYENNRLFIFVHFPIPGMAGLKHGQYYGFSSLSSDALLLVDLLKKYNCVMFSGHTHFAFETDYINPWMNVHNGGNPGTTVHVPSTAYPRDVDQNAIDNESQGYIVDVYKNGIIVRGIDFVNNRFVSDATFTIPTNVMEIPRIMVDVELGSNQLSINENETVVNTIKLNTPVNSDVTFDILVDNSNIVVTPETLTFTPDNYNLEQEITITGAHSTSPLSANNSVVSISGFNLEKDITFSVTVNDIDNGNDTIAWSLGEISSDGVIDSSSQADILSEKLLITNYQSVTFGSDVMTYGYPRIYYYDESDTFISRTSHVTTNEDYNMQLSCEGATYFIIKVTYETEPLIDLSNVHTLVTLYYK